MTSYQRSNAVLVLLIVIICIAIVLAVARAKREDNGVTITKSQPGENKKENVVVNSEEFTLLSTQNFPRQLDCIEVVQDKKIGEEYLVFFSDANLFVMRREKGGTNE